ncbi:MAG: peptidoglycan DD-metalloendopeptidase family protein [Dysgonamonadaceae bacterium]|nr:peptidoglycan DD-metalloendopeptidase family protein [Dysgonamonadaceae bacterium]
MNRIFLLSQPRMVLFGIIWACISILPAYAQTPAHSSREIETLTADKVKTGLETAAVDSMMVQLETLEEELYPADDIYDNWNTEYVKAYQNAVVPDSFRIDVSEFVMPVAGLQRITSPFGPRRRRFHYGTDLKVQTGDTIYAAFDGKVRVKNYERRGYGYYVVLRHPNGLETVYGHLSKFLVEQNENVKAGQPIALGGNTGRSTGSHLHFEFRFLGNAINPAEIIDFDEWAIKDDQYTFIKNKSGASSKYLAGGSDQIRYHRIRSGDTLGAIARRYGTTVNKLCRLNNMKGSSILRVGRSIRVS